MGKDEKARVRVRADDLEAWMREILVRAGADQPSSDAVAFGLVHGSIRGVDSHGVRLLPHYVLNLERGGVNPQPNITWRATFPGFLVVDADNGFGQLAGFRAIDLCIEAADRCGVAIAGVINSHHPGIMASYALRAAQRGYIAFAFTNTGPKILSHGGRRAYFGTNPVCFACPRKERTPFCLDMATSVVPWNKVEASRKTSTPLPEGCAADSDGEPTTDPIAADSLLPTGGYKGFGLAAMVEILCTSLLGQAFGYHTAQMYGPTADLTKPRAIGQFYLVARCDGVVPLPAFLDAVQMMTDEVRNEPPKRVPGKRKKVKKAKGKSNEKESRSEAEGQGDDVANNATSDGDLNGLSDKQGGAMANENQGEGSKDTNANEAAEETDEGRVMLAGDPEDIETEKRLRKGIPLDDAVHAELVRLGLHYTLPFPPRVITSSSLSSASSSSSPSLTPASSSSSSDASSSPSSATAHNNTAGGIQSSATSKARL